MFSGQALFYVARERRHLWSSRPGPLLVLSTLFYLTIITALALTGTIMAALSPVVIAGLFAAAVVFAFVLDQIKVVLFDHLLIG